VEKLVKVPVVKVFTAQMSVQNLRALTKNVECERQEIRKPWTYKPGNVLPKIRQKLVKDEQVNEVSYSREGVEDESVNCKVREVKSCCVESEVPKEWDIDREAKE
jgi:hypothetical protein